MVLAVSYDFLISSRFNSLLSPRAMKLWSGYRICPILRYVRMHLFVILWAPTFIIGFQHNFKTLLQQGISEPEFYGDLVYRFKKNVGKSNFSEQFRKLINRYKRNGYSLDITRQTAYLVVNPIIADGVCSVCACLGMSVSSSSGSGKGCVLWLWHSLDFSLTFFVIVPLPGLFSYFSSHKCWAYNFTQMLGMTISRESSTFRVLGSRSMALWLFLENIALDPTFIDGF